MSRVRGYRNKPFSSSSFGFGIVTRTAPLVPIVNAPSLTSSAPQPRLARQPSLLPQTKEITLLNCKDCLTAGCKFFSQCVASTIVESLLSSIPTNSNACLHQQLL